MGESRESDPRLGPVHAASYRPSRPGHGLAVSVERVRVGVVGCGLIGQRRARVAMGPASHCVAVADIDFERARTLASEIGAEAMARWEDLVDRDDLDVIV